MKPQARRERDQQRYRQRDEPARYEQALTADPLGEAAGGEVRDRLRDPERSDEAHDHRCGRELEILLADQRQDAAL